MVPSVEKILAAAALLLFSALLPAEEIALPAFDLEKVRASGVVSLPADYADDRSWPLIIDFHGAISPARKGANLTGRQVWSRFVDKAGCIVVGLNGRTRAWNMTVGEKNDRAYALAALGQMKKTYKIDPSRIYLSGFSSGADFLCSGGLQNEGRFAASLVLCPGPPNVVGLRDGSLLKAKDQPFYFVTGEEDYIRKNGAWQAFLALDKAGAKVMYREVAGVGHAAFAAAEYLRLFHTLEQMASKEGTREDAELAAAIAREDYLLASSWLLRQDAEPARKELAALGAKGEALIRAAEKIDSAAEPGRAYEAWWRIRTQFHRFDSLSGRAQKELDRIRAAISNRELLRARGHWFRSRRDQR